MFQTAIFFLTFSWKIARGVNSSLFILLSRLKNPEIEIVIPARQYSQEYKKSLNMADYLRKQKENTKVQRLKIQAIPEAESTRLFLN